MAALHRPELEAFLTEAAMRASAFQEGQRAIVATVNEIKVSYSSFYALFLIILFIIYIYMYIYLSITFLIFVHV